MTDNEPTEERQARPAKTRTSITVRPDYLARAKTIGPSVSGVIDQALSLLFTGIDEQGLQVGSDE